MSIVVDTIYVLSVCSVHGMTTGFRFGLPTLCRDIQGNRAGGMLCGGHGVLSELRSRGRHVREHLSHPHAMYVHELCALYEGSVWHVLLVCDVGDFHV